jgi:predicted unusual protein kinase regulating ubiquinone biosynthesis (AarF/ABC1/UbiB family)
MVNPGRPGFHSSQRHQEGILLAAARLYRTAMVMKTAAVLAARYIRVDLATRRAPPEERTRRMSAQHKRSAERIAALAGRLRGLLTKSGQYLSARPDLLPEEYIEPLARLQDAVPPKPYKLIARRIERELGQPVAALFAEFDPNPIASASLAQVHHAVLSGGREVAVKVLYPGVEDLVRADLRNLGLIVAVVARIWPRYDFRAIYREIARLVPAELDLHHEAANCERIAADLAERDDVLIPEILRDLSSLHVLTMSFVDGIGIGDVEAQRAAGLDPPSLAQRVVDIFGEQVLRHGFFHGDPHPGNIFALRDGRIALLDFGQALELGEQQRRAFAALSLAGWQRDLTGMIAAVRALGIGLPEQNDPAYMTMAAKALGATSVTRSSDTASDSADVSVLLAHNFRDVSIQNVAGEVLFVFRVQGLLRGLRSRLGSPGMVIVAWHAYAEALLDPILGPPAGAAEG